MKRGLRTPKLDTEGSGRIVRIRVNPQDCMGCVDLLNQLGVLEEGTSFATVVSNALYQLLSLARDNEIIPTRDGFEYMEMMEPFKDQPHLDRTRKVRITKEFKFAQRPRMETLGAAPSGATSSEGITNIKIKQLERRLKELHSQITNEPDDPNKEDRMRERAEVMVLLEEETQREIQKRKALGLDA